MDAVLLVLLYAVVADGRGQLLLQTLHLHLTVTVTVCVCVFL